MNEEGASTELDYEETLNALLSLIGRRVYVFVGGEDDAPPVAVAMRGILRRAEDDAEYRAASLAARGYDPGETLFFEIGGDGNARFSIPRDFFVGTLRLGDETLGIRCGVCDLMVATEEDMAETKGKE